MLRFLNAWLRKRKTRLMDVECSFGLDDVEDVTLVAQVLATPYRKERRKTKIMVCESDWDVTAVQMFISPFVASPTMVIRRLLTLAELKPYEVFYDLGAGDGRPVLLAAQEFGARAVGIELRQDLASQATKKVYELRLQDRVRIINGDLFRVDLRPADVVYLYLTTSANEKVRPKLEGELRRGARIVSHDYEMVGWTPVKVERFCENPGLGFPTHTLYVYRR